MDRDQEMSDEEIVKPDTEDEVAEVIPDEVKFLRAGNLLSPHAKTYGFNTSFQNLYGELVLH